jgi:hypothetical protein
MGDFENDPMIDLEVSTTDSNVGFSNGGNRLRRVDDKKYRIEMERTDLCEQMLDKIANSVSTFRPSESLYNLKNLMKDMNEVEMEKEQIEIDIVLSGGGLKGYFMAGCSHILCKELEKQNIRIARIAGTSAGSWAGMFMLTGFGPANWLETYFHCSSRPKLTLLEAYEVIWPLVKSRLPEDAYKICTGRLFINVTELTWYGTFRNRVISEFSSNEELFQACCASSMIPYVTYPSFSWKLRGFNCLDGGITNNTPVFPDGKRRQLVFRLYEVEYPWRQMINPTDTCIEMLALRGGLLMSRFLQGERMDSIAWLEKKETKETLNKMIKSNYFVRLAVLPIVVGGLIIARGTGMSSLLKTIRGLVKKNPGILIPFNKAGEYYSTSTVKYVGGLIVTHFVEFLRSINVLL